MIILYIILMAVAGFLALLLLAALFMKKDHYVKREITIQAPLQKVFDYVRLLRHQDEFNNRAMIDSDRKRTYRGTDGTVGYVYAWSGNRSAGEGEKEIMSIVEGKSVEMEIRFMKPMKTSSRIIMETEPLSENQTRVSWSNAGRLKYPFNLMVPMMERMLPRDMDASLNNLKTILEK